MTPVSPVMPVMPGSESLESPEEAWERGYRAGTNHVAAKGPMTAVPPYQPKAATLHHDKTPSLERDMVVDWLRERRDNALRIAESKQGEDRAGWMDDVGFFEKAADMLANLKSSERGKGK